MKKYINAKAEIYKLDTGDVMLISAENLSFTYSDDGGNVSTNKHFDDWGWNN